MMYDGIKNKRNLRIRKLRDRGGKVHYHVEGGSHQIRILGM